MARIGPRWAENVGGHINAMIDGFGALLEIAPKDHAERRLDIPYGPHERQRFDAFLPKDNGKNRPAVVFVHGGAFTDGSRNRSAEVYSNVLYYFSRFGIVGINSGYRLAADAPYPGATEDIAAIISHLRAHPGDYGIDPSRIFLMGHSAGGAHVGSYAYDPSCQPPGGPQIGGVIVVSGRVRADNRPENPNARKVEAYYGPDASRFDSVSPVSHVGKDSIPTFIACAEFDNPLIDVYCLELSYRLAAAKNRAPPTLWLKGHNHTSIIAHMNTAEDTLGAAIREFIAKPE
jgi:acetyl esterase